MRTVNVSFKFCRGNDTIRGVGVVDFNYVYLKRHRIEQKMFLIRFNVKRFVVLYFVKRSESC